VKVDGEEGGRRRRSSAEEEFGGGGEGSECRALPMEGPTVGV